MDGLYDVRQIGNGFNFLIPRLIELDRWSGMYEGNVTLLLPDGTVANGADFFDHNKDLIALKLGHMSSEYYVDGVLGNGYAISGADSAIASYEKDFKRRLYKASVDAITNWSWSGLGVYALKEDGHVIAPDPRSYFTIGELYAEDEDRIHVLLLRYFQPDDPTQYRDLNRLRFMPANRCLAVFYFPKEGISYQQLYEVRSDVIMGDPIGPVQKSDIIAIYTIGAYDSWYSDAESIWSELLIRETNNKRILNLDDQSPFVWPSGAKTAMQNLRSPIYGVNGELLANVLPGLDIGKNPSDQDYLNYLYRFVAPGLFLDTADIGKYGRAEPNYAHEAAMNQTKHLYDLFSLLSGVALTSFGYGLGAGESGEAREQAQTRAATRASNVRLKIEIVLNKIAEAAGYRITHAFKEPPFVNRAEFSRQFIERWNAGIYTLDEIREIFGLKPMENEEGNGTVNSQFAQMSEPNAST